MTREIKNEMDKLIQMLEQFEDTQEEYIFDLEKDDFGCYHILYPNNIIRECSVICNPMSYGHEEGLLEIMGLLTREESEDDDVVGWLTAEDVFNRIVKDWKENKYFYQS